MAMGQRRDEKLFSRKIFEYISINAIKWVIKMNTLNSIRIVFDSIFQFLIKLGSSDIYTSFHPHVISAICAYGRLTFHLENRVFYAFT